MTDDEIVTLGSFCDNPHVPLGMDGLHRQTALWWRCLAPGASGRHSQSSKSRSISSGASGLTRERREEFVEYARACVFPRSLRRLPLGFEWVAAH
jgi:hypothetical protein